MDNPTPEWMRCALTTFQVFLEWAPILEIPLAQNITENRAMYDLYRANLWPPPQSPTEPTVDLTSSQYNAASNRVQFQPSLPFGPAVDQSQSPYDTPVNRTQFPASIPPNPLMAQPQSPCYPALERPRPQTSLPLLQGQPPATRHCRHPRSVITPSANYNAAVLVQNTWLGPQGTSQSSNNAIITLQNDRNVYEGTQQSSKSSIAPVQNAHNIYQGTQQHFNNVIVPMQDIISRPVTNAPSMMPDTPQSSHVSTAASAFDTKGGEHSAKALEKAVENKANTYGLDSATTRQLRAYANAREKGIEALEPEDAVSQHIIYEFQKVRLQYPTWTIFPDYLPGDVRLLPGQKTYNRLGARNTEDECKIVRKNLHDRNGDRWRAAAAAPPMSSKPQGITKVRPVKQDKNKYQAPSPMQVSNASNSATSNQSYFTTAYSTMDQTMGRQSSNFASPTTMVATVPTPTMGKQPFNLTDTTTIPPVMALAPYDEPSHFIPSSRVPTGFTPEWGNRVGSITEPSEGLLQPMPAIGNEPSGPATSPITAPTPIQATSNELPLPVESATTGPIPHREKWTSNSRGVLCRKGTDHVPCHSGSSFPSESKFKARKTQGATNTTVVAPTTNQILAKEPTDAATETTAVFPPTTNQDAGNAPVNATTETTVIPLTINQVDSSDPTKTAEQTTDTNTDETPDSDGSKGPHGDWVDSLFEEALTSVLAEGMDFPELVP